MALTLRDVVENRASQRASILRRDAAETRHTVESRRERFSLEDANQRADLDASVRASATAKADAAKSNSSKLAAADSDAAKADTARTDRSKSQSEPAPAKASDTGRAVRSEATAKPVAGKPAPPTADAPASEGETAEPSAAAGEGQSGEATVAKAETASSATPVPTMSILAAPPASTAPTLAQANAAGGAGQEEDSEITATGSAPGATAALVGGTTGARGTAAAKPGFDAALAGLAPEGFDDDTAAAPISQGAEPSAGAGGSSILSASTESKAPTAIQQQAPAVPASALVPLGAVPMTIGLRALGATNRFEIRLDPKELGRIDVSIDIDKESGTVGARLVVDRPETLALLQRDASSLQQALAQTGLDASAGISLSLRGDGETSRDGTDAQAGRGGQTDSNGRASDTDPTPVDPVPLRALRGIGRVDIRI